MEHSSVGVPLNERVLFIFRGRFDIGLLNRGVDISSSQRSFSAP